MAPRIKLRGIRSPVPQGYILGRLSAGAGDAELLSLTDVVKFGIASVTGAASNNAATLDAAKDYADAGDVATLAAAEAQDAALLALIGTVVEASATGVSVTTGGVAVCFIDVPAGTWRIRGNLNYTGVGTTNTSGVMGISTTSAAPATGTRGEHYVSFACYAAGAVGSASLCGFDVVNAGPSTVRYYLNAKLAAATDTCDGYVRAERIA